MNILRISSQDLRAGARNTGLIEHAIATHPVHQLAVGDVGHAGVAAALNQFRQAWLAELHLRQGGATQAGQILTVAATDAEHLDTLLAQSSSRMMDA